MNKKNVLVLLLFIIIVVVFVTQFQKHNEKLKQKELKEEVLYLVKNAKLNQAGNILDSDASISEYGFGKLETANHGKLDLGRASKQYTGGKIIVHINGKIEATFYNDKWCATYNHTTGDVHIKDYDATCVLPTKGSSTEKEVSLDSDLIKNLKYPYMEPAQNSRLNKMKFYEKKSYSASDLTIEQKLSIAFDYNIYVKEWIYDQYEEKNISWEIDFLEIDPVLDNRMQEYFHSFWGPDSTYKANSFTSTFGTKATYMPDSKTYQVMIPYGVGIDEGGPSFTEIITVPYKATTKGDTLFLYEYGYYRKCTGIDACTFYQDYTLNDVITKTEDINQEINPSDFPTVKQYRYTFKRASDNNYYFEKGEWL